MEDRVYFEDIRPYLETLSENSRRIWGYAFTEILNNAIEHAQAGRIFIRLRKTVLDTEITITDDGIGLFRKIQMYMQDVHGKQASYEDVIAELYKGRMTTNPEEHMGEGIFFSSKIMEQFMICSDGAMFRTGYRGADRLLQSHLLACHVRIQRLGTMVYMRLENSCDRSLKEVFDMFAPEDEGFVRTILPIQKLCPYGEPIARSQARRLLYRLENFREVIFDFTGVDFMGQGFADEIFLIFQRKHPDIVLRATGKRNS